MIAKESPGPPIGRVRGIESLRALAALGVFWCHLATYWLGAREHLPGKLPQLAATGAHGVDFFVVISGFCLGLPVMRSSAPLDVGAFYVRRASRLLPPYLVALALASAVAMSPLYGHTVAERATWGDVTQHVLLIQTWNPDAVGRINGSLWSIALEAHLYLLFPVLLIAWRRWGAHIVVGCTALLSVAWGALAGLQTGTLGSEHVLPARLVQFAAGVWCAEMLCERRPIARATLWSGLVVGGIAALAVSTADVQVLTPTVWSVPSAAAVLLVASSRRHTVLENRPLIALGTTSYSFYLVHQPLQLLSGDFATRLVPNVLLRMAVGATVGALVVAALSAALFLGIERPSQGLGRRLGRRGERPPLLGTT